MNKKKSQNNETIKNITTTIQNGLEKSECVYTRNCPSCHQQITHSSTYYLKFATKKNSVCRKCSLVAATKRLKQMFIDGKNPTVGTKMSQEQKKVCSERSKKYALCGKENKMFGKTHSDETIKILSEKTKSLKWIGEKNPFYGKSHTTETKIMLSDARRGKKVKFSDDHRKNLSISLSGRPKSEEQRKKLSVSGKVRYLRELKTLGLLKIGYNPNACKIIDEYSKQLKTNFFHAMNGGEKRLDVYFVDGFSPELNLIIEIDEKHHFYNGKLKQKDIFRMNYIREKFGCKFIRLRYHKDGSYEEYMNDLNTQNHTFMKTKLHDGDLSTAQIFD